MSNISSRARVLLMSAATGVFRVAGKWLAAVVLVSVTAGFSSCGGGGGGSSTPSFTVSGTIQYATGPVVLQLINQNDYTPLGPPLTVVEPQFNVPVAYTIGANAPLGTPYYLQILPSSYPYQVCEPNSWDFRGPGTADVTGLAWVCGWAIAPVVSGLSPNDSVTLQISDPQTGTFLLPTFTEKYTANGGCPGGCWDVLNPVAPYTVTVASQPAGETCTVGAQQGTGGQTFITVPVVCTPSSFTVSGTVSGLSAGNSVVLQDNAANATTVSANGAFTFSTKIAYQSPYAVTVGTQPTGGSCAVTNGSGAMPAANLTNVAVVCTPAGYTIGGVVTGLFGGESVVLQDNGGNATTISSNGPFTFSTQIAYQSPYAVTVAAQPAGENCTVTNGSGTTPGSNVNSVAVACTAASYTIGGAVSGLSAGNSVALQDNGGNATTVSANGPFTFSTKIAYQSPYAVTVATQPTGESCSVTSGSGTTPATNVTNVSVVCVSAYTIGGTVSGLSAGNSVVLEDNGRNATTVSANGPFTFSTPVAYQSPYAVTVSTQPTGESCAVTNGSGTTPGANVTNVTVVCTSTADAGLWTWESGANTTAASFLGVYGTQGTAAPGNFPGGRGDAAFSWTDGAGNLWMFGGGGPGNSGVGGLFNDLWRYSPSTGLWAWMSGADTLGAQSVYGTLGTPAAGNVPSAREGGASWIDGTGNLWLFGGGGFDSTGHEDLGLSDLWRYSPSTGLWTWMNGPTTGNMVGVYGTQGTAAPANVPGGRTGLVSFKDGAGNFWLFGGAGFDSIGNGNSSLNDLWRYNPSSGMWTWVSGSNRGNAKGVYGTQGTAAAGNVPGARSGAVSWTDGAGNFWVFGGSGYDSTGSNSTLNDLWRYSPSTNLWTWMGGSNQGNSTGVYGTQGTAAAGNIPGARSSAVSWIDSAGNLWLFSGYGYDSVGNQGVLNDLWRYSPSTNLWTWMGGSATQGAAGVYGSEGTAAAGNIPGARQFASSWTDGAGNLWLFGGVVPAALNDLWKYVPPGP